MPNWVYNTLTIQGPKSEVDMIKDRLNKPFTLYEEDLSTVVFSLSLADFVQKYSRLVMV